MDEIQYNLDEMQLDTHTFKHVMSRIEGNILLLETTSHYNKKKSYYPSDCFWMHINTLHPVNFYYCDRKGNITFVYNLPVAIFMTAA